jgi:hypothetical protein
MYSARLKRSYRSFILKIMVGFSQSIMLIHNSTCTVTSFLHISLAWPWASLIQLCSSRTVVRACTQKYCYSCKMKKKTLIYVVFVGPPPTNGFYLLFFKTVIMFYTNTVPGTGTGYIGNGKVLYSTGTLFGLCLLKKLFSLGHEGNSELRKN